MFKVYLQISSILTTLISLVFLIKGTIGLSPKKITDLTLTNNGYKLELIDAFSTKIVSAKIGFSLLLFALFLQLVQIYFPVSIFPQLKNWRVIFYSLSSALIVSICAYFFADILSINFTKEIMEALIN